MIPAIVATQTTTSPASNSRVFIVLSIRCLPIVARSSFRYKPGSGEDAL